MKGQPCNIFMFPSFIKSPPLSDNTPNGEKQEGYPQTIFFKQNAISPHVKMKNNLHNFRGFKAFLSENVIFLH